MQKVLPLRVVVTENTDDGRSYIGSDGMMPGTLVQPNRPTALTDIWHIEHVPADPKASGEAPEGRPFTLAPLENGIVFRVVQFDPLTAGDLADLDGREVFASMNAASAHVGEKAPSALMHRTRTVDFGLVLQGTITMFTDDRSIDVHAGDVIIQKATNHAWENHGTEPALVAFVLIDANE
jgi:mannose-6-phosphate isomerase-like protein (cupin superfamily)